MNTRVLFIILATVVAVLMPVAAGQSTSQTQTQVPSTAGPQATYAPAEADFSNGQMSSNEDNTEGGHSYNAPSDTSGQQQQSDPLPLETSQNGHGKHYTNDETTDFDIPPSSTSPSNTPGPLPSNSSSAAGDDQVHYGTRTVKDGHYVYTPISHNGPPSSGEVPTPTSSCPGPCNPITGEGILDSEGHCTMICYNNLVLNQAGDDCVCPPTFQLDEQQVKCVCRSPFVQCGSKCVLKPSQQAASHQKSNKKRALPAQVPLAADLLHGKYPRTEIDRQNCPATEIACPLPSGGVECLDPDVTLDSCGGCASLGQGKNCLNITGAGDVGCNEGSCVVFNCAQGFKLVQGSCVPKMQKKH